MVEVKNDFRMLTTEFLSILYCTLSHIAEDGSVGVITCALRNLHDNWRLCLNGSLYDSLHLLHSVEVECWNSVATCYCSLEHLAGIHETQFFVTYHNN